MSNEDREKRAEWIAALCAIPSRFAGSISEQAAAEKVADWMRQLGVRETTFDAVVSRPRTGSTLALHAAAAAIGLWWGGFFGTLLAALSAWSFQREFSGGRLLLSNLLASPTAVNVVGRIGPAEPARRVVLSAHIDTAQAGWLFSPVLADLFARLARRRQTSEKPPPGPLALPRALVFAAAILAFGAWIGLHGFLFAGLKIAVFLGLALQVVLTLQWSGAAATPGANDNASAVASMLTCAETLLAYRPDDVELVLVGTGAEEVGCRGMHGFVESHLEWDRTSTLYVNFETTGGGSLYYIRSEGVLGKFGYPTRLLDVAERIAASGAAGPAGATDLLAATDGHVPAHHGYPSLSLISLEANGVPRNYHRPEDTVDTIDLPTVVRAADFGAAVVREALRR